MTTFIKDPDATLNYTFDWSQWLENGEVIQTSVFTVESGLTNSGDSNDTTTATITLSGGTVGESYTVTNRVTTNGGQIDDRSITISIAEQ